MMERLTGRNEKGDLLANGKMVYSGEFYETASALEEYEDLEEDGKLLELPCKLGDTVWLLHQTYTPKTGNAYGITEMKVSEQRGNELNPVWFIIDGEYGMTSFSPSSIGKTVFLTEQEALEALEEMKKRK